MRLALLLVCCGCGCPANQMNRYISGTMTLRLGDGSTLTLPPHENWGYLDGDLTVSFEDSVTVGHDDTSRSLERWHWIEAHHVRPGLAGSVDLATLDARLCARVGVGEQNNHCAPAQGTLTVRKLSRACDHDDQPDYLCHWSIDMDVDASARVADGDLAVAVTLLEADKAITYDCSSGGGGPTKYYGCSSAPGGAGACPGVLLVLALIGIRTWSRRR